MTLQIQLNQVMLICNNTVQFDSFIDFFFSNKFSLGEHKKKLFK